MTDRLHLQRLGACRTAYPNAPEACARILFLGEDNPVSAAPEHALFPYPPGCAGARFCHDILAVTQHTYLATWRTNLCVGKWSMRKARERATELLSASAPWTTIVMLGRRVAEAFSKHMHVGGVLAPFEVQRAERDGKTLVSLPHPSGRNVVWNDPSRAAHARALLAEVVPEYPWGEALKLDLKLPAGWMGGHSSDSGFE